MSLSFRRRELTQTFQMRYVLDMIAEELPVVLNLYAAIAVGELFRLLQRNMGLRVHDRIYTPRVLLWMMIQERLDARGTVASSVEQLVQGR